MGTRMRWFVALLALGAMAGACDDATTVEDGLTTGEAEELASAMADEAFAVSGDVAVASDDAGAEIRPLVVVTTTFEVTRTCPGGGDVTLAGERVREWDRETRNGTMDMTMTKTHNACVRTPREHAVTLDGDPNVEVAVHRAREGGDWSGEQTMSMDGAFTWSTDDGRSGTCVVDIDAVYDPETQTRTVTGTFCDRTIERTTTWS